MRPSATLYKYRGVEPWEYLLDILVNGRLYAAKFTSLNDPMEGIFSYSQDHASPSFVEQMIEHKAQYGICSLSEVHNSTLMWSYYASAHKGVVFGLKVNSECQNDVTISSVKYCRENVFKGFLGSDAATEAKKILSKKLTPWRHEREVRVFTRSSFVPVSLETVYLGCLMPQNTKDLLREVIHRLTPDVVIKEMQREDLDRRLNDGI